jgi:hypothetical protein
VGGFCLSSKPAFASAPGQPEAGFGRTDASPAITATAFSSGQPIGYKKIDVSERALGNRPKSLLQSVDRDGWSAYLYPMVRFPPIFKVVKTGVGMLRNAKVGE